ncbi:MAG: 30S ribosomal protein S8 [Gemmatimonadetes bacterium]|nr:30S ribosomal protein S8 [Gemmatimonadota bacterium]
MTDPISDLLTRIRNGLRAKQRWVDVPLSKQKIEIVRLLKENHYIHDYKVLEEGHGLLRIYLRYHEGQPVIRNLQRVSKSGRRRYVTVGEIPRVRSGLGMVILSTSRGVLSDRTARQQRVGGEMIAIVW